MIYASLAKKFRVFIGLFLLIGIAACRETPRQPATWDEERQDADYLTQLEKTDTINTLGAKSDDSGLVEQTDYNRTIGRTSHKDYWRNREFRLNMVGRRILIAAYPLCPHEFRSRGMMVGVATRSRSHPIVEWAITPFGKMDRQTLKLGDEILAMGDQEIPTGITGGLTARSILADYANRMEPLRFYVKRANRDDDGYSYLHITQPPYNFCNYKIVYEIDREFDAYSKPDNTIHFTSGAVAALPTDDELGFVFGHETAHLVMDHIPKQEIIRYLTLFAQVAANRIDDVTILGGAATNDSFSRDFEAEADYVGVYFAAAAGYDPAGALSATQFIAKLEPDYIHYSGIFGTHPSTSERYTQLRKTVEQIRLKQASGQPILPDFD